MVEELVVGEASMALDLACTIVHIVLWEVSQVLPTVVQGGKIIKKCVSYICYSGMGHNSAH